MLQHAREIYYLSKKKKPNSQLRQTPQSKNTATENHRNQAVIVFNLR